MGDGLVKQSYVNEMIPPPIKHFAVKSEANIKMEAIKTESCNSGNSENNRRSFDSAIRESLHFDPTEFACAEIEECDIGISLEKVKEIDEDELELMFRLALKRLIKFRKKERIEFGRVPSVAYDPRCFKAFECMKAMQKRGEIAGIKLELKL